MINNQKKHESRNTGRGLIPMLILFTFTAIMIAVSGCSSSQNTGKSSNDASSSVTSSSLSASSASSSAPVYRKISAKEAKDRMNQNPNAVILDVRTKEEYDSGHIKDALLIPDVEILQKAESTLPDKTAMILVYCRSGRRSALAANDLIGLGYSNVYDFGGIIDWNYEVVK